MIVMIFISCNPKESKSESLEQKQEQKSFIFDFTATQSENELKIEAFLENKGNETVYLLTTTCEGEQYSIKFDSTQLDLAPKILCNASFPKLDSILPKQKHYFTTYFWTKTKVEKLKLGFDFFQVEKEYKIPKNININIFNRPENEQNIIWSEEKKINKNQAQDLGKIWLQDLFKCDNSSGFCWFQEDEKDLCTERFYQFMIDSEEIFGASNLTDEERAEAERKYKENWSKIYPLRNGTHTWLFGRGNGDIDVLKEVKIKKIEELKYEVFVDFGEGNYKTKSVVKLVPSGKNFKIDFCETVFLN